MPFLRTVGALAGLAMFLPSIARADDPPAPAPTPVVEATPAPATPAPTTPKPQEQEPPDDGHFRWGISPMLGTFFPGRTTFALGMELRIGYAFNQRFTIYGNSVAVAGLGFGGDADPNNPSVSISAISFWQLGANVDALVAGPLFIGGGAAVGKAGWGAVDAHASANGGGSRVVAAGGFTPSVDGRIGISTGSPNPQTGKRNGFYLALDVRVLFAPNSTETSTEGSANGAQAQAKVSDTTAVGVCPMLHIGFDSR